MRDYGCIEGTIGKVEHEEIRGAQEETSLLHMNQHVKLFHLLVCSLVTGLDEYKKWVNHSYTFIHIRKIIGAWIRVNVMEVKS